ncbi:hypothetical protein CLAFUW4_13765 [Fulvia fulva]|uniref:Uncharacterized protein n=1 Tax=Passalora fulva TaxID=5499 RepID=A0A9Q8PLP0_PASFU|nr:uncharacterized protein CLAFUR5_13612 [Fulvia fulva]KAK4610716.1 hypothetical protein CLAFUR4_13768 [Fulvia fulva]KAK4611128.1 hypothetical protein CLAFUR0_13772 [Fulvia fulva]UJO24682.1 hypothetical protein CLAFUR5_13612 [Fulvia fulva]WPV22056.1 hypothetical protein CLAFUW4_13765 [Fulvia fulva]WPV36886.1 hypothetical protein CLAFUW7_13773 [Fulvia fulva]
MQATRRLLQHRQPLIKFVGRRHQIPQKIDHAPIAHPAAPSSELPKSFAQYREEATQHGPLKGGQKSSTAPSGGNPGTVGGGGAKPQSPTNPYGSIGGKSARELGPIRAGKGEVLDRNDLPRRFQRVPWSQAEIDAIESGGASMFA